MLCRPVTGLAIVAELVPPTVWQSTQAVGVAGFQLGGTRPPDAGLREALLEHAKSHLGEEAGIRVSYRYEVLMR